MHPIQSAQRVRPEDIEAEIASEHFFTARHGRGGAIAAGQYAGRERPEVDDADLAPLGLLTFCVLVLRNGYTVTGESACASAETFNAETGRKIAREKAVEKVWSLLGFRLRDKLARQAREEQSTPKPEGPGRLDCPSCHHISFLAGDSYTCTGKCGVRLV